MRLNPFPRSLSEVFLGISLENLGQSDPPTAYHYQRAERELYTWYNNGGLDAVTDSRIDMHVLSQITDRSYIQLDRMTMREYQPYLEWLLAATLMPPARVVGTGPWTLLGCTCCLSDCGLLCICDKVCECEDSPELYTFREMTTRDLHVVARGSRQIDTYKRAEILTDGLVDVTEIPFGKFRLLNMAIERSLSDPFWPAPDASLSTDGTTSSESSSPSPDTVSSPSATL